MKTVRRAFIVPVILAALAASLAPAGAASIGPPLSRSTPASPVEEGRQCLRGSDQTPANLPRAFQLFSGAAQKGDPLAAYYLGMMYQNGMAVARNMPAAAHWLQFAANRETPAAMFALAKLYLAGDGVKRDELAARRWIEKAADLDYPEAVMAMAIGLRDGSMGFERNEALAETQMRFANRALKLAGATR
jgi:TPR repeat protein